MGAVIFAGGGDAAHGGVVCGGRLRLAAGVVVGEDDGVRPHFAEYVAEGAHIQRHLVGADIRHRFGAQQQEVRIYHVQFQPLAQPAREPLADVRMHV